MEVTTPARRVLAETTAQAAVGSLMGLLMATSGCPHTAVFRPMARFHLPLADEGETLYRAAAAYMLAQYFAAVEGRPVDLSLAGLAEVYRNVEAVNAAIAARLRAASEADSAPNALILLDMYAKALPMVLDDGLAELRPLFAPLLDRPPAAPRGEREPEPAAR